MMIKIGLKIQPQHESLSLDKNCIYEIATQRQQDKKFVIFDIFNEPKYLTEEEILKNFIILEENKNSNNSINNGGSTDYYKFKANWKECQDIIESRELNFSQGNIFKSAFCFNIGRHNATDYQRELNKIIYFANRELERIKNDTISKN